MSGPPVFDSSGADDEEARRWLSALRSGSPEEKAQARRALAEIFESRGLVSEGVDLLVTNAREGYRDAELFQALARMYRRLGDEYLAASAALEATRLSAPQPAGVVRPQPDAGPGPQHRAAPSKTPPRAPAALSTSRTSAPNWRLPLRVAGWIIVLATLGAAGAFASQHPAAAAVYLVSAGALGLLLTGSTSMHRLVRLPDGPLGEGLLVFVWLLALLTAGALLPRPLTVSGSQAQPGSLATPAAISTPSPSPSPPTPSP